MQRKRLQNGWVKATGKNRRTWTGFWYEYSEADGERKRRQRCYILGARSEMTKGQAEEKLRGIVRRREAGLPIEEELPSEPKVELPANETFKAAGVRFLALKSGDWSKSMRGGMASIFKRQVYPRIGEKKIAEIRPSDMKALYNEVAANCSDSMVRSCVTYTRAVFDMLIDDGILTANPAEKAEKPKNTKAVSKVYLSISEIGRLVQVATGREYIILRILLLCALRPSELFALRLKDVHQGKLRIDEAYVPANGLKTTKTTESDGWVPLSQTLERELREYIQAAGILDPEEFLFPTEVGTAISHDNYLDRILKPLGVLAKIPKVNFQILRRTVATHLQNHGQPKSVQKLLRHADVETTLKHYQQALDQNVLEASQSWDTELAKISDGVMMGQSVSKFIN